MRKWNFNPGPAVLPIPVLERLAQGVLEFNGLGMSILEISHRSKDFEAVLGDTQRLLAELLGIPDTHDTMFLGGGASLQFAMVPMNFLAGGVADYVITGSWAKKALKEAKLLGKPNVAATTESESFTRLPRSDEMKWTPGAKYVHMTSNNTIYGTQWRTFPATPAGVPVVCDMSSDILSRRVDVSRFALIYAGAQKNLGPAGVTVVVYKKDWLAACPDNIPTMMSYKTHAAENSLYNTPPVFAIWAVKLVLEWARDQGGLEAIERQNARKAELLYGVMDANPDYFRGTVVDKGSRSWMNVPFRLPTEDLEAKFLKEAGAAGFVGLKGHRSVGGIRVSMYNALPAAGIEALCHFMEEFRKRG
jgi:phosphoserine aminotransferase